VGRKSQFDQQSVCEALIKSRGNLSVAAGLLKVSRTSVANWIAADPMCKEAYDLANDQLLDAFENVLIQQGLVKKEAWAIQFFLNARGKKRGYGKTTVEETGALLEEWTKAHRAHHTALANQQRVIEAQLSVAEAEDD
jgi:hypothetical protein